MLLNGKSCIHEFVFTKISVLSGKNYEKVCEMCHISVNKAAIFGENGAISLGGARIGKFRPTVYGDGAFIS